MTEHNIEAAADAIMSARHSDDELAERLRQAWAKYVQFFTEPPHGTFKQIRAMLEFMPAAQPKPESWQEIAREAAEKHFENWHSDLTLDSLTNIILAAIARSHATQPQGFDEHVAKMDKEHPDWLKGKHGATSLMAVAREFWDAAARSQPPSSTKATDDKQQEEWWVEQTADGDWSLGVGNRGFALFDEQSVALDVRDRHNAELAALREELFRMTQLDGKRQHALAAERQLREQAEEDVLELNTYVQQAKDKLLSAQAAIEKHNAEHVDDTFCCIKLDLSALHEHDAEMRKPLVDMLLKCRREIQTPMSKRTMTLVNEIDALAKA